MGEFDHNTPPNANSSNNNNNNNNHHHHHQGQNNNKRTRKRREKEKALKRAKLKQEKSGESLSLVFVLNLIQPTGLAKKQENKKKKYQIYQNNILETKLSKYAPSINCSCNQIRRWLYDVVFVVVGL